MRMMMKELISKKELKQRENEGENETVAVRKEKDMKREECP